MNNAEDDNLQAASSNLEGGNDAAESSFACRPSTISMQGGKTPPKEGITVPGFDGPSYSNYRERGDNLRGHKIGAGKSSSNKIRNTNSLVHNKRCDAGPSFAFGNRLCVPKGVDRKKSRNLRAGRKATLVAGVSLTPYFSSDSQASFSFGERWHQNHGVASRTVRHPGTESYEIYTRPSGPKHSMHSRKNTICKDSLPGPGSYAVNTTYTSPTPPAFSFGIPLSRSSLDMASTPGPGSYDIKAKRFGPSFSITGRQERFNFKDSPGPGSYNTRRTASMEGPSYSLGSRLHPPRNSRSPGPGSYHLKAKPSGPCFSITGRLSPSRSDEAPGPGAYSQSFPPSSPAFSIYSKAHEPKIAVEMPGPGAYSLPTPRDGPFFSLLGRISPIPECTSSNPGPGNYTAQSGISETPAFSFGNRIIESSNSSSRDNSPGPGEYNAPSISAAPSFSFGTKPPKHRTQLGPGPGSYESFLGSSGPQFSLHGRLASASHTVSFPGPGTYKPQYNPHYRPAFSIKGRIDMSVRMDTPGPGAYRPSMDLVVSSPPKFSLGSRLDGSSNLKLHSNEKPGPGAYNCQEYGADGPAFSMLKRFELRSSKSFPGPGTYKILCSRSDSPAFSFGSRVDQLIRNEVPGPGTYRFEYKASGPAFSITGRPSKFDLGCNPGPGSYDDRLYRVGRNGPFFSLLGRIVNKQRDTSPGPGAYKPKLPPDGPSFSIHGRITPMVHM